ncbi:MAG: site-2 protease family protein [Acidobacteria bacterium]|nr:site-2 protease family protein [Acidobacteriota bacterium]
MLEKRLTIFRLLGFEVKLHISWAIIALLIAWSLAKGFFPFHFPNLSPATYWWMGAVGALGLFLSIILHELAHSLVAKKYGLPIKGITLFIFGGVAEMEEEPASPDAEFRMAIAGPIASILLGAGFYGFSVLGKELAWPVPLTGLLFYLGWINWILAIFNLVPAFPLDGGRVLRAFLWNRKGNLRKATRTASNIGAAFGAWLIVAGGLLFLMGNILGGMWWFLIGLFLRSASQSSYQQLLIRKALEGEPIRRFMTPEPVVISPALSIEDLVEDYIYKYHHELFPVMADSKLLGCVRAQQVKQIPRNEWTQHSVQELTSTSSSENTVPADMDAIHVLSRMQQSGNSRLMVVEGSRLVGIVVLKDLLAFLALKMDLEGNE